MELAGGIHEGERVIDSCGSPINARACTYFVAMRVYYANHSAGGAGSLGTIATCRLACLRT